MKKYLGIFMNQEEFSWRKAGTALCYLVFGTANIGYLITHKFDELPASYLYILAGVFAFYFGKELITGFKEKLGKN